MTRGESRARRMNAMTTLVFVSTWINTIGALWLAGAFIALSPVWQVYSNDFSLFHYTPIRCTISESYKGKDRNGIKVDQNVTAILFTEKANYFTLKDVFKYDFSILLGYNKPECPLDQLNKILERDGADLIKYHKKYYWTNLVKQSTSPLLEEIHSINRESKYQFSGNKAGLFDYLITIIWALIIAVAFTPIIKIANRIWEMIFGDSNKIVWVR